MATDAWQQARSAVVRLWRRVRPEHAAAVESELEEVRAEALAAREANDGEVELGLAADWQRKLQRLLAADPHVGIELRRVLDEELTPLLPQAQRERVLSLSMEATATGHGRVYQAGRDQRIIEK